MSKTYTTQLQAGLGTVYETRALLDIWSEGMTAQTLYERALKSGQFPKMSARRLRNVVVECFAPRYLADGAKAAALLKALLAHLTTNEFHQLQFLYTCRANAVLADFVRDLYWPAYAAGRHVISNGDAREFIVQASQSGRTTSPWSPSTIRRMSGYLTGACADFGLLESGAKSVRKVLPFRIESRVAVILAYDRHCAASSDVRVLDSPDWALFGLQTEDVLAEMKRLVLKGAWLVQSAGDVVRISWQYASMEELIDAIAGGKL